MIAQNPCVTLDTNMLIIWNFFLFPSPEASDQTTSHKLWSAALLMDEQ